MVAGSKTAVCGAGKTSKPDQLPLRGTHLFGRVDIGRRVGAIERCNDQRPQPFTREVLLKRLQIVDRAGALRSKRSQPIFLAPAGRFLFVIGAWDSDRRSGPLRRRRRFGFGQTQPLAGIVGKKSRRMLHEENLPGTRRVDFFDQAVVALFALEVHFRLERRRHDRRVAAAPQRAVDVRLLVSGFPDNLLADPSERQADVQSAHEKVAQRGGEGARNRHCNPRLPIPASPHRRSACWVSDRARPRWR